MYHQRRVLVKPLHHPIPQGYRLGYQENAIPLYLRL
jgi:hypothetical protein